MHDPEAAGAAERGQREEIHQRKIDLRFYRLADGRHEIEGRLVDTKSHPFRRQLAQADTQPGDALHDITVRLVVDEALQVLEAVAVMRAAPFDDCQGAALTLASLKGLRIGPGWNKRVRELLGTSSSCTHIVELLGPMATTVLQGLAPLRMATINEPGNEQQRLAKVASCYAYAVERRVVARLWPQFHRPQRDDAK